MGIFNRAIPNIQTNNLNQVRVIPEEYYVDDIFDPLFNAKVKEQLRQKYGNPLLGTIGGYMEGIDNALLGQDDKWGILGPGMGVLSGFGRSMDKAGDVIIGGLTEGVKGVTGQGFENPLENIFVEDEDYTGTRLLAAMGNSMAGLAKAPQLTEADFKGLWNIPGMALELGTDPGILGGAISKGAKSINIAEQVAGQSASSKLADFGQLLMDYDDFMAKVAIDLTAPGLRLAGKTLLDKIQQKLGNSSAKAFAEVINNPKETPEARMQAQEQMRNDPEITSLIEMVDEVGKADSMIEQAELTNNVNLNDAQVALGVATAVPNAVQEEIAKRTYSSPSSTEILPPTEQFDYDTNVGNWLLTQPELDAWTVNLIRKAYTSDLNELIAAEAQSATNKAALAKAIHSSNLEDIRLRSQREADFLESDWAKEHLKVRNPNLYMQVPDEFDLDELDILSLKDRAASEASSRNRKMHYAGTSEKPYSDEVAEKIAFKETVNSTARKELYNRIHSLAKELHFSSKPNVNINYLEDVMPRELAEKSPDDFPAIYNIYLNRLNKGFFENESARNTILTKLGFDPKSRTAKFIEHTPFKLSPSYYHGRSDTTLKLQVQYADKILTDFVNKYSLKDLVNNVDFERAFLNDSTRKRILKQLHELTSDKSKLTAIDYIEKVKDFSDSLIDSRYTVPEDVDKELNIFKALEEAVPDGNFAEVFSFDELYPALSAKTLPNLSLDEREALLSKIKKLDDLGINYATAKRILNTKYSNLKKEDVIKNIRLKELGLTKSDIKAYDSVLKRYESFQTQAADIHYKNLGIEENSFLDEITELSEDLQRNVVQSFERREGPIREINPLPRYSREDTGDIVPDEFTEEELTTGTVNMDGSGKWRNRAVSDIYGYNNNQLLNNIIRLNAEEFKTQEALDNLRKYLGDSYQIKAHSDAGVFEGVATDAIKAFTDDRTGILKDVEYLIQHDYLPYTYMSKESVDKLRKAKKLKEGTAGYRIAAALGNIPNVNASPYASEFRTIIDTIVKDFTFTNSNKPVPEMFTEFIENKSKSNDLKNTPNIRLVYKHIFSNTLKNHSDEIRSALRRIGVPVSHRDILEAYLKGEPLSQREFRLLNTAVQETPIIERVLSSYAPDIFDTTPSYNFIQELDEFKKYAKDLSKGIVPEYLRKLDDIHSIRPHTIGKHMSEKDILKVLLKKYSTAFVDLTDELPAYLDVVNHIDRFKYSKNITPDDFIEYFIEHPTEYPNWISPYTELIKNPQVYPYMQYQQRYSGAPLKQSGWIDYSYLYGSRKNILWEEVINRTTSPWRDPVTFKEASSPKNAIQNLLIEDAKLPVNSKNANVVETGYLANVVEAPAKQAAEIIVDPPTFNEAAASKVLNALDVPEESVEAIFKNTNASPDPPNPYSEPPKAPPRASTPKEKFELFKLISDSVIAKSVSTTKDKATLRTSFVKSIIDDADLLMTRHGIKPEDIAEYKRVQIHLSGAKVKHDEFLDTLASSGMFQMAYKPGEDFTDAMKAIAHNVAEVNVAMGSNVLKPFRHKLSNGNTVIGAMWDTSNKKVLNIVEQNYKKLDQHKLYDITRLEAGGLSDSLVEYISSDKYRRIDELFDRVRQQEGEYARLIGFKFDDARHVKNVKVTSPDVANYLANIVYKDIPIDDLDDISDKMMNLDAFKHLRGSWGTRKYDKRFIGFIEDFEADGLRIFEDSADRIVKGSLAEGSFNNSKFQLYVDLFENDNFKINTYFSSIDELKKVLYAKLEDGSQSGNLQNLVLAAPRKDKTGRIIGFTQFDKTTDAGLQSALNNADTVLLPSHVFSSLDKVLRKDAKMSNKVFAFIQKHLTLPFKFGVLMNPGFLIGNANDAYLKQATTMAQKYGTSVPEELSNVAVAIRDVLVLNNDFDEAYRRFLTHIQAEGIGIAPSNQISSLAATDPRIRKMLKDYVNDKLRKGNGKAIIPCGLTTKERNTVKLWMMLNSIHTTAALSDGFQDLDIIAKAKNSSKYQMAKNPIDRVLTGQGEYVADDISTWGLFVNNPLSRAVMDGSESIENTFRAASILNDFRHKGMDSKWFADYFNKLDELKEAAKSSESSARFRDELKKKFNVDMTEAINTMHNANFDYERMTDFTDTVGTFVPFPTFFLKNLGYWLDIMVNNPQYIDHAITVQESMWGSRDTSEDKFAAEAKGRGAVPVSFGSGQNLSNFFKGIFKPTPLQSMFGAFSLINNPVEDVYYRLHPMLSSGITMAGQLPPAKPIAAKVLPSENVKYRPYSTDMYERNITRDDPKFNPIEYAIHRANPLERPLQTALRLPDKLRNNEAQLSDFSPSVFQPDFGEKYVK